MADYDIWKQGYEAGLQFAKRGGTPPPNPYAEGPELEPLEAFVSRVLSPIKGIDAIYLSPGYTSTVFVVVREHDAIDHVVLLDAEHLLEDEYNTMIIVRAHQGRDFEALFKGYTRIPLESTLRERMDKARQQERKLSSYDRE